jgi:carbamoyltransferase
MKIIGFSSWNHDSSVSLIEDGEIIACYANERFSRDKYDLSSNPILAFENLIKDFSINLNDPNLYFVTAIPVHAINPFISSILEHTYEIKVYDHHKCHNAGAYYTSGFKDKTLCVSLDSSSSTNWFKNKITKKDLNNATYDAQYFKSIYGAVYLGEDNQLTLLEEIEGAPTNLSFEYFNSGNSLSWMWGQIVVRFGFKFKDEGKIMGLAPQGNFNKELYNSLKQFANFDSNIVMSFDEYADKLELEGWFSDEQKRKDLAHTWQRISEDVMVEYIYKLQQKYPNCKKLCLSGGFFANVKINQKINEYLNFEEIYIMPAMGDVGLSIGAACLRAKEIMPFETKRWDNVFLGKEYSNNEIFPLIQYSNFKIKPTDPKYIAEKLKEGKLVGLFRGKEEYGPRALGNRTILCDPRKKENHEYINKKLDRNEIMPFAPMIMSEYINEICYAYKSVRAAEFMTMCFTVKDHWIDQIPAVIQNDDKSCRAQIIFKDRNEFCWEILNEFYSITGTPVLLNTSFNDHGEPIINTPEQAIEKFKNDVVDILILNNMLLEK